MFTMSNALLMSRANVILRSGGLFAICVGDVNVFSLKIIVLFWVVLANPCIVFQGVCVLCL